MAITLKSRGVIEVSGEEARDFLQSLVTNDVKALGGGEAQWAGLLTPQGKILFDFIIVAAGDDRYLLDAPAARRDALLRRLMMYRLRRAVEIAPRDELAVVVDMAGGEPGGGLREVVAAFPDPRLDELGWRAIVAREAADGLSADESRWHDRRIALGVPDSDMDIGSGELFPHEADFDKLGGVSFTKGCYVGQEVVSRMQHRATVRKRLLPVEGDGPLRGGAEIGGAGKRVGKVFSTSGNRGMALIRMDRAGQALSAGEALEAGGATLRLVRPPWADFDIAGAGWA